MRQYDKLQFGDIYMTVKYDQKWPASPKAADKNNAQFRTPCTLALATPDPVVEAPTAIWANLLPTPMK